MKYLVTATPKTALTQEVYAANADTAIALALENPNRWKRLPEPVAADSQNWNYGAVRLGEPDDA